MHADPGSACRLLAAPQFGEEGLKGGMGGGGGFGGGGGAGFHPRDANDLFAEVGGPAEMAGSCLHCRTG